MALLLGATLLIGACTSTPSSGTGGSATPAGSGGTGGFDMAAALAYCTSSGGVVVTRTPTGNTNGDPQSQLPLAGTAQFCAFETGSGQSATRISADLHTIYSTQPTIAAIAYLSKLPPLLPAQPSANPAAYNCEQQLHGTQSFGNVPGSSGGWVDASQPTFTVMNF